jgi:hypothetical protein
MANTYERNICAELHCPSACCRKPFHAVAENLKELKDFAENIPIKFIEPSDFLTTQDFFPSTEKSILAEDGIGNDGAISIITPGDCPHLGDNACGDIAKRLKACAIPVGGAHCTISRRNFDLSPVTKSMIDALG